MNFISLQSGSSGNCMYVESGGIRLLFDAGLSAKQVQARLAATGRSALGIHALFISHDHSDHTRSAGALSRSFNIPIFITPKTFNAVARRCADLGDHPLIHHFKVGECVQISHVTVETYATPHDGVDGCVFVVDDGHCRIGICTDLGHVTPALELLTNSVDALFLESNYDEAMLLHSRYHKRLKRRIEGPGGHISNLDAAELVANFRSNKMQWLCLAHLSQHNNTPKLALQTHLNVIQPKFPIHIAPRYAASAVLEVMPRANYQGLLNTPNDNLNAAPLLTCDRQLLGPNHLRRRSVFAANY